MLKGHTDTDEAAPASVEACVFSPDGERICSSSDDGTLRLWDGRPGAALAVLKGHTDWVGRCAFSPDGEWIFSAGLDRTVRFWNAGSGEPLATLPLLGEGGSLALHPRRPIVACGDTGGGIYVAELVGVEAGPIVVTAVTRGSGRAFRCPGCHQYLSLQEGWLGQEITCPDVGCAGRMRLNPFVVGRS